MSLKKKDMVQVYGGAKASAKEGRYKIPKQIEGEKNKMSNENTKNIRKRITAILFATMMILSVFSVAVPTLLVSAQSNSSDNYSLSSEINNTLNSSKFAFVFFHAEWCDFCQEQKPIIDELEQGYVENITFIRVDADNNSEAMNEFNVSALPTMFLILNKSANIYEYQKFEGFMEKTVLADSFDNLIYGSVTTEPEDPEVPTGEDTTENDNLSSDQSKLLLAIETSNASICAEITNQTYKDECYFRVASALSDSSICNGITNEDKLDRCYLGIAIKTQDSLMCEHVSNQSHRDWCYREIAQNKGEESLCQKIIDVDTSDTCIWRINQKNLDYSVCEKLKNPETKDYCYFEVALNNNDTETCENIIDEETKDFCYQAINRDNQSTDSTISDGFSEEIVYVGNPVTCKRIYGQTGSLYEYWYECNGVRITQIARGYDDTDIRSFQVHEDRAVWEYGEFGEYYEYAWYSNSVHGGVIYRITQITDWIDDTDIRSFQVHEDRAVWEYGEFGEYYEYAWYSGRLQGSTDGGGNTIYQTIRRLTQMADWLDDSYINVFQVGLGDRPYRATWEYGFGIGSSIYEEAYYYTCLTSGSIRRISQLGRFNTHVCCLQVSGDRATWRYFNGIEWTTHSKTLKSCEPTCDATDTSCGVYPNCVNCNNMDDWYNVGGSYSCCDGNNKCTCQDQEYRNYYCSGDSCTYSATGAKTLKSSCLDCGSDYCEAWSSNYCKGNDVYHSRTCHRRGCSDGACYDNTYTDEQVVDYCASGCSNGACIVNSPPNADADGSYVVNEGSPITFDASDSTDPDGDALQYRWDFNNDGTWDTGWSSSPTASYSWSDDWSGTAKVEVSDGKLTDADTASITVNNVAPTADFGNDGPKDEGSAVTVSFSNQYDPGTSDTFTYSFDWDNDGTFDIVDQASASAQHTWGDDGVYTVQGRIKDNDGGYTDYTTVVTVNNVAPTVGVISAPLDPIPVGDVISASAGFTDPGYDDTHTAKWNWGDGTTSGGTVSENHVSGSHAYSTPGIYTITLTVTDDDDGASAPAIFQFVVVYDPEGGFVTGGGWIDSPVGAYRADPSLTGKAHFGFISKYQKGATTPTGKTEFKFKAADLNFKSDTYDWLVIAGARAKYKGIGTINGVGNYGFMLSAIDGDLLGPGKSDMFRMKIWDKATEELVYDNQLDALDDADPTTVIGGGSIKIHKSEKK